MGPHGPMADPHLGWREGREEVPCSDGQAGRRVEKKRKEWGRAQGLRSPLLPPSFLPGLFWPPQPLTSGVGESSSPCVQDVGLSSRPGVGSDGKNMTPKARPTHLSKLRACGGQGRERKKSIW